MLVNRGDSPDEFARETNNSVSRETSRALTVDPQVLIATGTQLIEQMVNVFMPARNAFTKHTSEWWNMQELITHNWKMVRELQVQLDRIVSRLPSEDQ